jgi:hypothetical protein
MAVLDKEKKVEEVATTSSPEETKQPQTDLKVETETKPKTEEPTQEPLEKEGEEAEPKKSRLDKRVENLERKKQGIESLLETLNQKRKENEAVQREEIPAEFLRTDNPQVPPILQPGETEISPDELEQRIAMREQALREQIKSEVRQELEMKQKRQEYAQMMQSHIDEWKEVEKLPMMEDEDFANEVKELYEKNSFILGLDGQLVFLGAVRPKEAYELVKQKFERLKQKFSGQAAQKLIDQISSSAVSPSLQPQEQEVSIEELRKNLWENPGKVASILEKKLIKS